MFGKNPEEKPVLMMGIRKSGRKFTELRKIDEIAEHPLSSYPGFFSGERISTPTPVREEDYQLPPILDVEEFNSGDESARDAASSFTVNNKS